MDTSKRDVSWLARFPPDIWAYFVLYLPGEQLGRLMMTGATFLWQRLKSPKVVKSVSIGKDYIVFKSYPRFLNDFPSLDELSIHSCNLQSSHEFGLKLDLIPSGVKKLELLGSWGETFAANSTILNFYKRLPQLETLHFWGTDIPDNAWLAHSPQSLTKLLLHRWDGAVELPSSLIHFEAIHASLAKPASLSKLPPHLEVFLVEVTLSGVDLLVSLLPPSICKLTLSVLPLYSNLPRSPQNLLGQLPKSLLSFTVPRVRDFHFDLAPELTSLLPTTLTELSIHSNFPTSAWSLLPQQLTGLSLEYPRFPLPTSASRVIDNEVLNYEVTALPFDTLPRSITRLKLAGTEDFLFCGPPATSCFSFFPPQLTRLSIPRIELSPATAKLLPSSLTHLKFGNLCKAVCKHLPAGLKTLKSCKTLMSPSLIERLPKSLTVLKLSIYRPIPHWLNYNTNESISPGLQLMESAIHEMYLMDTCDWKGFSPLPPTLINLKIEGDYDLGDSFLQFQHLPNLLTLSFPVSQHFTDLAFPLPSPHLTTLNLESSGRISGKSFQFLPRCLTSLSLKSSSSIFDSDIQHLPRTLKDANLTNAIQLTELCIPDLPPHLEILCMAKNWRISQSSISRFPYPIRSSQGGSTAEFEDWYIFDGLISLK